MQIVAHRGASGGAPENTLAAINRAWELGINGVEIDLHLSRDGVPVCIHDPHTGRLCGVERLVSEQTLAELKLLDAGSWKGDEFSGERIPTLKEAIATVPERKTLLVEVKDVPGQQLIEALTPIFESMRDVLATRQIHFMSFYPDVLWALEGHFRDLTLLMLVEKLNRLPMRIPRKIPGDALPAHGIGFSHKLDIPTDKLDALNAAGAILAVWTENDPTRKAYWEERGFDYLITDWPERFL